MNPVPPITTTFIRPFYSAETALRLNLVQARSLHFNRRGTVASCDLRGEQRAVTAIAILTRPTPGAPGRALFPGGDGETQCSKVRADGVRYGPSLRSQAATGPCGLIHR